MLNFFKRKKTVIFLIVAIAIVGFWAFMPEAKADDDILALEYSGGDVDVKDTGECLTTSFGVWTGINLMSCIGHLGYIILTIFSWFLSLVGFIFNMVFDITLVNMKANISTIQVVEVGWVIVRDLTNILFIFMLLYLAISTILQLDEHGVKHGLSRLIIGAVLINFSLFFVKVPIDVSNILAIQIYNKIMPEEGAKDASGKGAPLTIGLGDAFMSMFSLQTAYNKDFEIPKSNLSQDPLSTENLTKPAMTESPFSTTFMAIILMFVTGLVFLSVSLIFIKRFITLIMLMIFSPLAFAGMAIPNHDIEHQISQKFWSRLIKESFYAPVFLFITYLAFKMGTAISGAHLIGDNTASFAFKWLPVGNIISYTVVIMMMIFALTAAETMGVEGSAQAMKAFGSMRAGATGWVGTNTISRVASTIINSKREDASWGDNMRDMAAGKKGKNMFSKFGYTMLGRTAVNTFDKLGSSFDNKAEESRKWMEDAISNQHGSHELTAQLFAQASLDSGFSKERKAADNQFHHMSIDQKANMKKYLEDMSQPGSEYEAGAKAALVRYYTNHGHGRLEEDEVAELPRKEAGELTYYDNKFRHLVSEGDHSKIREFIRNSGSEAQMTSAIRSLGAEAKKFEGDEGESLRELLRDEVRKKFSGGGFFESIGKDNILGEGIRSAVASGGYEQKITHNLYEAIKSNPDAAKNSKLTDKFVEKLSKLDSEKDAELMKAIEQYKISKKNNDEEKMDNDLKTIIGAYENGRLSTDEITKNLAQQTNGKRVMLKSPEIAAEIAKLEAELSRKEVITDPDDPKEKKEVDVYKVKLS